jgi:ABC-2 type transport system permease protein
MNGLANIRAVIRREFLVRVRTRSFVLGTALLVVAVIAVALLPVLFSYLDRSEPQRIGVVVDAADLASDPVAALEVLLDPPQTDPAAPARPDAYDVSRVADLAAARTAVLQGDLVAVLRISRDADGELAFTLFTEQPRARQVGLLATSSLAVADRLARLGVDPEQQAGLFGPPRYTVAWPDPDQAGTAPDDAQTGTDYLLGFGLTVLIFMLIVLYGNWIAMSVVEEKSSRVMEVILNAATPFQLLTGKVLGVGAVALTQYGAILLAGVVALVAQGPIAQLVLGAEASSVPLPAGLTVGMLLLLGVFGVLGFLLYGVLYAAAGSLVSRQEDVQAAVMPLALVSTAAYLIAVYAGTGLLDIRDDWIAVVAQVPFISPFLMLSRIAAGETTALEVALAIGLLVVAIGVALWLAARLYAAGVLLYGQRPGIRSLWRLARGGM